MTKFNSIWGDLSVREESIIPAPSSRDKEPVVKKKEADDAAEEAATVTTTDLTETEIDDNLKKDDIKNTTIVPQKKVEGKEVEEEEEYEYTEDDISKAFGMLEDEGVLELTEEDDFDSSPKGLADAIAATVRNQVKKEIEGTPVVVQQFYAHVNSGGDPNEFVAEKQTDWDEVDMSQEDNQKTALATLYMQQGMSLAEANEEVEDIPEDKLEKKAGFAAGVLVKNQTAMKAANTAARDKASKEAAKNAEKDVNDLKKVIDDLDELAGFKIDKARKAEFKDYLFKVKPRTGRTQMQENMKDEDRRMQIAFLDFVNYTKADLEKEVKTTLTKTRKKRLTRYTDTATKNRNNAASVKTKLNKGKGKLVIPSIFGPETIEVED